MNTSAKICVYAICKNESKFIDRWIASLQNEADCVVVLDTGSTDDSVEKLKSYEPFVTVKQYDYTKNNIQFRFDKARNDSLKLVPSDADICIVLDLDQVPKKGWSDIIRKHFKNGYHEIYGYIVNHEDGNDSQLDRWTSRNVHPNSPYWIWDKVIHEGIEYYGKDEVKTIFDENFIIDHYPDSGKDRSLYLELLNYSCKEYPKNPHYGIYYGVELSKRDTREKAAEAFKRCLDECEFDDYKLKYQTYLNYAIYVDNHDDAIDALRRARALGIETRRMYRIYCDIYEKNEEYDKAIEALEKALTVQSLSNDWTDDINLYNGYIEDRLSLIYYYQKNNVLKAIEYCVKALQYESCDIYRLSNNLHFYYEEFKKQGESK